MWHKFTILASIACQIASVFAAAPRAIPENRSRKIAPKVFIIAMAGILCF
jgi:hypothetical protein